jgi:hypothetical protein
MMEISSRDDWDDERKRMNNEFLFSFFEWSRDTMKTWKDNKDIKQH